MTLNTHSARLFGVCLYRPGDEDLLSAIRKCGRFSQMLVGRWCAVRVVIAKLGTTSNPGQVWERAYGIRCKQIF